MPPASERQMSCTPQHQMCIPEQGNLTIFDHCVCCSCADRQCRVWSSNATTFSASSEESVTPQQCYVPNSNKMSVQWCQFSSVHSRCLIPCAANLCITPQDHPTNTVLLNSLLKEAKSTEFPLSLGSNSTVDHSNELLRALTKSTTHPHKHQKKPTGQPPTNLYAAIIVPVVAVTLLIGFIFYFIRREILQQKKTLEQADQQQQQLGENNQVTAMEMGALALREDRRDDTKSVASKEMGGLSKPSSTSSSTFTRPRLAPYPPPTSPPPNRPLPPIPARKTKNPLVVAEGHGGEDDLDMLPQWHLIYDAADRSSSSSKD